MMRHLLNTSILVQGDDNRTIGIGYSNISTLSTTSTRYTMMQIIHFFFYVCAFVF